MRITTIVFVLIVILCVVMAAVIAKNISVARATYIRGGATTAWWERPIDNQNISLLNKFVDTQIVRRVPGKDRAPLRYELLQAFRSPKRRREHLERARKIYQRTRRPHWGIPGRAKSRVKSIERYLEGARFGSGRVYVDVGCGDADITRAIGEHIGVPAAHRYCVDIKDPPENQAGITYLRTDGKTIPLPDKKAGLVTAFMSMHHFGSNLVPMIGELRRVLADDGLLIIREHDVGHSRGNVHANKRAYLDWVHQVYSVVVEGEGVSVYEPADYRSAAGWDGVLGDHGGFTRMAGPDPSNDKFFGYIAVYRHSN